MRAESFGVVADKWRGCKYKESSHSRGILNDGASTLTHYRAGSTWSASLGVKQGGCPWFNEQITIFVNPQSQIDEFQVDCIFTSLRERDSKR